MLKLAACFIESPPAFAAKVVDSPPRTSARGGAILPFALDHSRRLKTVERRVERSLFELERPRAGFFQPPEDFKTMGVAAPQSGEHEGFEMAPQGVAVDSCHALVYSLSRHLCQCLDADIMRA